EALAAGSEGARRRAEEHGARADELASALRAVRTAGAAELEIAVAGRLEELALKGARLTVSIAPRSLYEGGSETVEFEFSANSGQEARPLARVASGGELSRVALALDLIAPAGDAGTLVFDEVDAGVGGEAA